MAEFANLTFSKKTFHRKFEENDYGFIAPSDFPEIDWAEIKDIEKLFPLWKRELLAMSASDARDTRQVKIEDFTLYTPYGDACLFITPV